MKYIKTKSTNIIHYMSENEAELIAYSKAHKDMDGTTYPESDWEVGEAPEKEIMVLLAKQDSDNEKYDSKRMREYPTIEDQLDKIYHEGIDVWKNDMIKPIKDKYPKE